MLTTTQLPVGLVFVRGDKGCLVSKKKVIFQNWFKAPKATCLRSKVGKEAFILSPILKSKQTLM